MTESTDPIVQNVQAIADLERAALHDRSPLERVTDAITEGTGSFAFVFAHVVWFGVWIIVNQIRPFDAYPFSLLNLMVSLEAIILTSFVLMTQNRMTKQADRRAHLDLQVNLLAEQELTAILHMLHALCQHAGCTVTVRDARVEQLLQQTDIQKLAGTLDKELSTK
jgi:uncharacterized membrane protein